MPMTLEDLKVNLGDIKLIHPLMNGGGTCKRIEEVEMFVKSETAAIEIGSITVEPQAGNHGDVYFCNEIFSLNSNGLPNHGLQYYKDNLPKMIKLAHEASKPIFVNVAGETTEEYIELAQAVSQFSIDLIVLNCSCPNVWEKNGQKKILCYDL